MMQIFIYIKERVVKRKFHIILGLRNFSILWKNIKRDSFNFEMKRLKTILRTSNYEKSPLKVKRNEMGYVSSPLYWRNRTSSEGENPEGSKGSLSLGIRKNRNASRRGRETEGSYTPALRRDSRFHSIHCPGRHMAFALSRRESFFSCQASDKTIMKIDSEVNHARTRTRIHNGGL